MQIVRFSRDGGPAQVGILRGDKIASLPQPGGLSELLAKPLEEIRKLLAAADAEIPLAAARMLAPIDGRMEVWAAGVTYERSRDARVEESGQTTVYDSIYDADRPELFFKSPAWRVTTNGEPIGIRADTRSCIPEPEFAVVANRYGEIVGATVCNDMTARTIEADNPLYLPQAKIFEGSCGIAHGIRPWWELATPADLAISLEISRAGQTHFAGSSSTRQLRRDPQTLLSWLFRAQPFPDGVILSTGTGIVPPLELSLQPGDEITIDIQDVGTLRQSVQGSRYDR
ncbi:fumarylacetoacetate hydrolase family protein [Nonomuraea sp. NPDC050536]|uniref:fumarylacetoacetate hydrolase family protein n=1 Tax=Nonomuraea sp. NPDC050536 TaxID=3364366 RepID=UPI0037C7F29D